MAAVLDTNVVGIVRVLHAFLPLLELSENGTVVNVGSGLGSFGRVHDPERAESRVPSLLPYPVSKAAVSMLTVQYARAYPGLRINVVDPGPTATDLNRHQGFQTVEQGAAPHRPGGTPRSGGSHGRLPRRRGRQPLVTTGPAGR
ncbi:hypothetical protein GCM10020295_04250 [Streptomyces cinereospinus]